MFDFLKKKKGGGDQTDKDVVERKEGGGSELASAFGNNALQLMVRTAGQIGEELGDVFDIFRSDEEKAQEVLEKSKAIPNQDIIYEMLSHTAAYGKIDDASLMQWGYELLEVYEDPQTGLRAISIRPGNYDLSKFPALEEALAQQHGGLDVRPVVVFRGTAETGGVIDDLNPTGVGTAQIAANEGALASLFAGASAFGPVDVCGHSLGGSLAQLAACRFPGMVGRIATFQSPGIDSSEADKLAAHNERNPDNAIESTHYRVDGDLVHLGGEEHTKGQVITFDKTGAENVLTGHTSQALAELNDLRGGAVARTYHAGQYEERKDGREMVDPKAGARLAESRLEGVKIETTEEANGFFSQWGEKVRKGAGSAAIGMDMDDMDVGGFDQYARAWESLKALQDRGASQEELAEFTDKNFDGDGQERARTQFELLFGYGY